MIKGRRRDYTEEEWRRIARDELQHLAPGKSPTAAVIENLLLVQEVTEESKADARRIGLEELARVKK